MAGVPVRDHVADDLARQLVATYGVGALERAKEAVKRHADFDDAEGERLWDAVTEAVCRLIASQ